MAGDGREWRSGSQAAHRQTQDVGIPSQMNCDHHGICGVANRWFCTAAFGHSLTTEKGKPMNAQAAGTFAVKSWQEKAFQELEEGGKLTRASVVKTYEGDLEGCGTLEYL